MIPSSIVVTRALAKKLFGQDDIIGKTVKLDNKDVFNVSGVIKDLPGNTEFNYEFLTPWSYMVRRGDNDSSWGNNSTRNIVLLKPNTDIKALNEHIKDITIHHEGPDGTTPVFLYPLSGEHLFSNFENRKRVGGVSRWSGRFC